MSGFVKGMLDIYKSDRSVGFGMEAVNGVCLWDDSDKNRAKFLPAGSSFILMESIDYL